MVPASLDFTNKKGAIAKFRPEDSSRMKNGAILSTVFYNSAMLQRDHRLRVGPVRVVILPVDLPELSKGEIPAKAQEKAQEEQRMFKKLCDQDGNCKFRGHVGITVDFKPSFTFGESGNYSVKLLQGDGRVVEVPGKWLILEALIPSFHPSAFNAYLAQKERAALILKAELKAAMDALPNKIKGARSHGLPLSS